MIGLLTRYICTGCGLAAVHIEAWADPGDRPTGLPLDHRLCECGTGLLVTDGSPEWIGDPGCDGSPRERRAARRSSARRSGRQNGRRGH